MSAPSVQFVEDVPVVDATAAQASASRLYRTSSLAQAGLTLVGSARAPSWWGQAESGYDSARAATSGGLTAVDQAAARLGRALDDYARDAPPTLRRWQDAVDDLARARAHPVPPGADGILDPAAQARVEQGLLADIEAATARFRSVTADLVNHAQAISTGLDTVRGVEDHLQQGVDYLIQAATESGVATVTLAIGWIDDPARWWRQVQGVGTGLVQAIAHPLRTSIQASGAQAYREGDYGVGAAQSATMGAAGLGTLHQILRHGVLDAGDRNRSTGHPDLPAGGRDHSTAPLVLPQTTDELFHGVDLTRQEANNRAHTIERHVGHTEEHLLARSERMAAARRDGLPRPASGFPDLPTAERAVDLALTDRRPEVDAWLAGHGERLEIVADVGQTIGISTWKLDGEILVERQTVVTVVLARDGVGNPFVLTAYPGDRAP